MQKKQFKAESKRLLDLMINSIYTHKEIFLRELISNASDAIDKMYYKALTDKEISFNKEDFYIRIDVDKDSRTVKITDTGIGMTDAELETNLGVIAKSGSLDFKSSLKDQAASAASDGQDGSAGDSSAVDSSADINIIGQFGVGFYSAFMVAEEVIVVTRAYGSDSAFEWRSKGADGYTITSGEKQSHGTEITLKIKASTEDENYDEYLEQYTLQSLIKKYSDFIRYPIKMFTQKSRLKEGSDKEYESYTEDQTVNSMVPIWRKNKNELTDEDYTKFYTDKHYGYDKPLKHIHINAEGAVNYRAILYIPQNPPFDFYTKDFERGLELYSSGVMIMNKCADLLPDYFGFVQGLVDSENLSLNISRELLQHDRQLRFIAKRLKDRIKSELSDMLNNDRENYEKFYKAFGRTLKFGIYSGYGANRDTLEDLIMFYSSTEKKPVTLAEYLSRMKEEQKYIYYASGESVDKIAKLPYTEVIADSGYEILYLTEDVDEFALKMLTNYKEKPFKSIAEGDLGLDGDKEDDKDKKPDKKDKKLYEAIKEILQDKVSDVRASKRLKSHPVCLTSEGGLSIEMEKVLKAMPDAQGAKAQKILEINPNHQVFEALKSAHEGKDKEKLQLYAKLLYNQAMLIEGLSVEDPVEFAADICSLMK